MSDQLELVAEERIVLGKKVGQLRRQGIVPANVYGQNQPSVPLQVNGTALRKLLHRGAKNVILLLKVGNRPTVPALIKKVQLDPISGETTHVDFFRVAATETLKTSVKLLFVNEAPAASKGGVTVLRSMNEVLVECLPADLPSAIQVDLSQLSEAGAVIRVGDLTVGPAVTILTDHNDMVAGLYQQARMEKPEEAEVKTEGVAVAPETPARGGTARQ